MSVQADNKIGVEIFQMGQTTAKVSRHPRPNFYTCPAASSEKLGSGHVHWENWVLIIKRNWNLVSPIRLLR